MTTPATAHLPSPDETISFPRQAAATRHFRLGAPRSITVSPDGTRVVFVRSAGGTDPANRLWVSDVPAVTDGEGPLAPPREVVDPVALLGTGDEDLPAAERARRERMRETTGGVTAYATDSDVTMAAFALSGRLFVVSLSEGGPARELDVPGPVVDPRPSPDGTRIAYVADRALHVVGVDGTGHRVLAGPDTDDITWGLADFVAAEELDRTRGFWWAPDSLSLLAQRTDESPVPIWWISDPANPDRAPRQHRYPAAGGPNPAVSLWHVNLTGAAREIAWDTDAWPYLARVQWSASAGVWVTLLTRDQQHVRTVVVDLTRSEPTSNLLSERVDPAWVEVVGRGPIPVPMGPSQRIHVLDVVDDASTDTRRAALDGGPFSPVGVQVRGVVMADVNGVVASVATTPTSSHLVRIAFDGSVTPLVTEPGWHSAIAGGATLVVSSTALDRTGGRLRIFSGGNEIGEIESFAAVPVVRPAVTLLRAGERELATAVLFPSDHERGSVRLPVLMSPYGGPHAQRVVEAGNAYLDAQWLADQGFAVVIADGRGTPGRGPAWERAVHRDLATAVLDDQVAVLEAVAAQYPDDIDASRVGIRGWSFGGYLAALAVMRRPDVFHAAVAGAPVTEWRLYDTAYTERYLGNPTTDARPYDATSLIPLAAGLSRPLLLVHGLADDNVVVAHTLQLSAALLAAGRPHTVLPLSGVTHMTPQEVVAENLLRLEVEFLTRHLHPQT